MKFNKSDAPSATFSRPEHRLEKQDLTSLSGFILFQSLFALLGLYLRLAGYFRSSVGCPIYSHAEIILLRVVHMLLDFRYQCESHYYGDDPMTLFLISLKQLPAILTISLQFSLLDENCAHKFEALRRELVLDRVTKLDSPRIVLDFDGSVIVTKRQAYGTAVGFNKSKKDQRSYYPIHRPVGCSAC